MKANRRIELALLALFLSLAVVSARAGVFAPGTTIYSQPELDQMLAPIALYPDPLLSQVLMGATHPLEVVEAARWSRAHPELQGEAAVAAVQPYPWDPSVKSLVAFPQLLNEMDERLEWTERLGNAFLAQQAEVMDTIQALRERAYEAGSLSSSEPLYVQSNDDELLIEPASPNVVYVPYYDPMVVYGPWWWSAYPPVSWRVWRDYYWRDHWRRLAWGPPVAVSRGFFFGRWDWHRHRVMVDHNEHYHRLENVHAPSIITNGVAPWHHDPWRGGVIARHPNGNIPRPSVPPPVVPRPAPVVRTPPDHTNLPSSRPIPQWTARHGGMPRPPAPAQAAPPQHAVVAIPSVPPAHRIGMLPSVPRLPQPNHAPPGPAPHGPPTGKPSGGERPHHR